MKLVIGPGTHVQILNSDGSLFPILIRKMSFACEAGALPTMELSLEVYSEDQAVEIEVLDFDLTKEVGSKLQSLATTTSKPTYNPSLLEKVDPGPPLPPEAILDQFKL